MLLLPIRIPEAERHPALALLPLFDLCLIGTPDGRVGSQRTLLPLPTTGRAEMLIVLSKFLSLTKEGHDPKQVTFRGDERDFSVS